MRLLVLTLSLLTAVSAVAQSPQLDDGGVERFANLALACVHKEYPNKIAHVLESDKDVQPPRKLTPAFYGCYDWHSSVHGHWLLARLARQYPDHPLAARASAALARSLTTANIAEEVRYINGPGRGPFERPYGLAWLLQLGSELREWNSPEAQQRSKALEPLERAAADRIRNWLGKLSFPVRSGEHSQTAFGLGLILDWARANDQPLATQVEKRIRDFYLKDRNCALSYEPSGEDFLSPCLAEADVMRRVMGREEYAAWLGAFLPVIPMDGSGAWLSPAVVTDPTDGKLAHLDGLNLSRAWMLDGMASALPVNDPRVAAIAAARDAHASSGLKAVTGAHYEGGHWLGSFATYLVTKRGIR